MRLKTIIWKLKQKWIKLRLQPIRVFCLHHVCEKFDDESMYPCDWMELSVFRSKINELRNQGWQFISLTAAYQRLKNDRFRRKKYAVLTFDDGYKSLLEVLPWLEEQNIPVTLFINGKYLDGISYRENPREQYLTYDELFNHTSPLIEIGHHGWEHTYLPNMTESELIQSIKLNKNILSPHPRYIPFWAYTCGKYTCNAARILYKQKCIIPLTINGGTNYTFDAHINRELL